MKIDGINANTNPPTYANAINTRLAVPSHIDFDINFVGDSTGGMAYISITAEQEPALSYPIKVWSVILEDHEIATSAWGGYNGKEMMWIPVAYPLGSQGKILNFTGPYPQTISVAGSYTLNPTIHPIDNLNVATFVQYASGTKEVLNSNFMDLPDPATGVSGEEPALPSAVLTVAPNPSNGNLSISCLLPAEETGTVQVFDIAGRVVESFPVDGAISTFIEESGVYFVQLTTGSGEIIKRQLAIIR
ncbi:MAG: T9SS type A sorting domain-containing protein [Candidatus Aegiribacteria sp.]|nr:T9SS type A sorting domain-containing protein [Candidatus Aegiribacteria sp.]